MISWNWVDLLLVVVVLLGMFLGWRRGFVLGALDLAVLLGSLLLGFLFYQPLGQWLSRAFGWSEIWAIPAAFLIIAILAVVLISIAGRWLLHRIPRAVHHGVLNRALGTLPGLINGLIAAFIIVVLLLSLPLPGSLAAEVRSSQISNRLVTHTERLEVALADIFGGAASRLLTLLTVDPESEQRVDLPFAVSDPQPRPDLETEMLRLINEEREAAGLPPLAADPALREVARAHSSDMFAQGYFSHITPEGLTPFDRMQNAGVGFVVAGENIALAPTLSRAHTGIMNSPGHRANILRPQFGRAGIGILDGGSYGLMVTQNFRN